MATNTSGAQSSPSMRQWLYTSPYYNPMTMRASVLEELNDYLIYGGYQPGFIQFKDRNLTGDLNLQLHDDQLRATFASSIRLQEPDIVVFFMEHIFLHRHTQDGKKGDMRFRISLDKPTWIWLLEEMKILNSSSPCTFYLVIMPHSSLTRKMERNSRLFICC